MAEPQTVSSQVVASYWRGFISRGWKKGQLTAGDQITVEGFGAKNGKNITNATTDTLPDGRKLFGGFASTPGSPVK